MTADEVAKLVEVMADSLADDPGQFNLTVHVTGFKVQQTVTQPGTAVGMVSAPVVSGPGASVVGFQANPTVGDVEIGRAEAAFDEALRPTIVMLRELAQAVSEGKARKVSTIRAKLGKAAVSVPVVLDSLDAALKLIH